MAKRVGKRKVVPGEVAEAVPANPGRTAPAALEAEAAPAVVVPPVAASQAPAAPPRPEPGPRRGPAPPEPPAAPPHPTGPRLYLIHPLLVGALPEWDRAFAHAASLGFDGVLLPPLSTPGGSGSLFHIGDPDRPHPALESPVEMAETIALLAEQAARHGLSLYLDVVLDRVAADGALAAAEPGWFGSAAQAGPPDPRATLPEPGTLRARLDEAAVAEALGAYWQQRLESYAAAGVAGFRCLAPDRVPPALWRRLARALPSARLLAWTPGMAAEAVAPLREAGFAACFDSLAWWDLAGDWLAEEARRLALLAPVLATVEAPFGRRLAARHEDPREATAAAIRHLRLAAGIGAGLLVPMGFEYGARRALDAARDRPGDWDWLRGNANCDLCEELRAVNRAMTERALATAELRPLAGPGAPVVALLRAEAADVREARRASLVVANTALHAPTSIAAATLLPAAGGLFAGFAPCWPAGGAPLHPQDVLHLAPGEALVFRAEAGAPVLTEVGPHHALRGHVEGEGAIAAAQSPRIAIEAVSPAIEAGRFPVKRSLGEMVRVTCDIICDGHDKLGAVLQWRAADEDAWQELRLTPRPNDVWEGRFPLERMGRHLYRIEAWRDAFATFRDELEKKHAAGLDLTLELEEGRRLVEKAGARDPKLAELAQRLAAEPARGLTWLLSPDTAAMMAAADDRPFRVTSAEMPVEAERTGAGFASWYELFPRNYGGLRGVMAELPHIRAMGFDVLYFPPIHPIGAKNRKGRNNSLEPAPDDPGSPYAIGSAEGGHDALHPELGTLEDFRALREAAAEHGMELALDFAIQCSPDHPWLREHRDWFDWRPDGSIKYAENPPKKYQDIVNVDFYAAGAVPGLWLALREAVRFWVAQGVRIFRVDNPHTKPLPFWEWLIGSIRAQHPDCLFLAEAFTRPKMMYRLGKVGFSQSYTYFTWRNTKAEITEYLQELSVPPVSDFYRPHFFVNTPDINPVFLQTGGRPAHLIRAALAATLSGLWGVFQGFELCDPAPLPGREEYLNSDKYEVRHRPQRCHGDIVQEITQLNAIRRANPALHSQQGIAFHNAFNDQVLWYRKQNADRSNVVLCAVSLDPAGPQDATVELPLWEWGLPDHAALEAEDLVRGTRFLWQGKVQRLRLDPAQPYGLWRVRPAGVAR